MNCEVLEEISHKYANTAYSEYSEDGIQFFRITDQVAQKAKHRYVWYSTKHVKIRAYLADFVPSTNTRVQEEFERNVNIWRKETKFLSSVHAITNHPAYKAIIALGRPVVPLILRDLRAHGGSWYFALRRITRNNPVTEEAMGDIEKMTEAWLEWGQKNL